MSACQILARALSIAGKSAIGVVHSLPDPPSTNLTNSERAMSRYILVAALPVLLASCESPNDVPIQITYVPVNIQSERIELRTVDSTSRFDRVRARFRDSVVMSGITIEGVSFNGLDLPLIDANEGEYGIDSARISSIVPGAMQVFRVKEGRGFPPLTDSVQFPVELLASAPAPGATFSKRQGIALAWTPASDGESIVGYSVETSPERRYAFSLHNVPDNGAHVIEPRFIANLAPGPIYVFITRLRNEEGSVYGDRVYRLAAASTTIIEATLVP